MFKTNTGRITGTARKLIAVSAIRNGLACLVLTAAVVFAASTTALAAERTLAGLRIFMPVKVILQRFGDPTYISTGANIATFDYLPGHMEVIPPAQSSGAGPMGGGSAYLSSTDPGENFTSPDISRYYYVFPKNLTYEFVLSPNGRILSIKVLGYKSSVRTSRGIGLGSTYADVVEKYGYPEEHSLTGSNGGEPVLTATYMNRDHVAFRFVDDKVVGIIVSAAE